VPGLVFFGLLALLPMAGVVHLSLTSWDGTTAPQFVGWQNWSRFLGDHQVVQSTIVTGIILLGNIAVRAPISILLGAWSAGRQRNRAVPSAIFFLPLLLSTRAALRVLTQKAALGLLDLDWKPDRFQISPTAATQPEVQARETRETRETRFDSPTTTPSRAASPKSPSSSSTTPKACCHSPPPPPLNRRHRADRR
jgi:hypothetical protein